jgi:hypothetical protein
MSVLDGDPARQDYLALARTRLADDDAGNDR